MKKPDYQLTDISVEESKVISGGKKEWI